MEGGLSHANCMYSAQLLVDKAWQRQVQERTQRKECPGKAWDLHGILNKVLT